MAGEHAAAGQAHINLQEELVMEAPERPDVLAISADLKRFAWSIPVDDEKVALRFNGQDGPAFDSIEDVALSPIGNRCAYVARNGQQWVVTVDGQPSEPMGVRPEDLAFSADGTRVAYRIPVGGQVRRGGGSWEFSAVVVDGRRYDYKSYRFSPVGASVALLNAPNLQDALIHTATGPIERSSYERLLALLLAQKPGRAALLSGSTEKDLGAAVQNVFFSPDGSHVASVVLLGSDISPVDYGKFLASWLRKGQLIIPNAHFGLEVDGTMVAKDSVDPETDVVFSPDGRSVAYRNILGNESTSLAVDGRLVDPKPGWIGSFAFSHDGAAIAYTHSTVSPKRPAGLFASGGVGSLVVRSVADLTVQRTLNIDSKHLLFATQAWFSPDSNRVALALFDDWFREGGWATLWLFSDLKSSPAVHSMDPLWDPGCGAPVFSPDSRVMVNWRNRSGESSVIVNGDLVATYTSRIEPRFIFDSTSQFQFIASRITAGGRGKTKGFKLYRVLATIPPPTVVAPPRDGGHS